MPRTVEVVLPLGRAEELLPPVRALEGVVAVLLQHGGAVEPPGDVLKIVVSNDAFGHLLELLRQPDGRAAGAADHRRRRVAGRSRTTRT